jgi:hypothetical protein
MKFGTNVGLDSFSRSVEGNLDRMTPAKIFPGPPAKNAKKPMFTLKVTGNKNGNDFLARTRDYVSTL